ncbi:electron transport complex subunit RsxB [Orrella marina]|uniref:Electron transport complex subunit RsxB n=1 Tax=Orrella marina TaxID=2163011 RepID=A0A2R4XIZ9_9BURK|nr:electron transport complex subunit RsxB [Orrella marina]AWB33807.1 electron transport complex subunit RsxB [Orrella marina]
MSDADQQILIQTIDAILPQTQCTQCGYDGCMPYAEALARGEADINRCPPGDESGMRALASLLGRAPKPIDPACGQPGPLTVAVIDEEHCVGCTLCIKACPVDAIIGANKRMHTVLPDWCTGCDLCVAPCPVDCITMTPVSDPALMWGPRRAAQARERHQSRLARKRDSNAQSSARTNRLARPSQSDKENVVAAALAKARERRMARS